MSAHTTMPYLARLLVIGAAASCTSLAGLDGDYALGQDGGAAGTSTTSTGTGGSGGTSASSSGSGGSSTSSTGTGGQGATGGSSASGSGGSGGAGGAGGGGGGGGGGPTCTPIGLVDAFNGTVVDQNNWNLQGQSNMLVVSNGTLKLDGGQPGVSGGWAGLVTPQHFDVNGHCVWIEVLDLHHNGLVGSTYWQLYSGGTVASFNASDGNLSFHIATNNGAASASLSYDAIAHRWWRMREAAGTLYMETSPEGKVWTERLSAQSPTILNNVAVGLGVTGANEQPIVGCTELDNLNVAPP